MARELDLARVAAVHAEETARFVRERPRSAALVAEARATMPLGVPMSWMDWLFDHPPLYVESGDGAWFTDVDGHRYLDMYLGITVGSTGHSHPAIVDAVTDRVRRGIAFGLPTEDALAVSRLLAERWGLPKWQFALTSTQSITDVLRLARIVTGRDRVVVFGGHYHGHLGELLAVEDGEDGTAPEYEGITADDIGRTRIARWNDLASVEAALADGSVALVIAEPALTNSGVVFPATGFHAGLRDLTRATGTLLCIDETQTLPMAFGGLTRAWGLEADAVVLGKSLGGGVPVSAYGFSERIAAVMEREAAPFEVMGDAIDEPAVGGTLFGNALSMAAARAGLEGVWTVETHERTARLAGRIADAMRDRFAAAGFDWNVYAIGNRAGYRPHPVPPVSNEEAGERDVPALRHAQRAFMANRGVWEFGWWAGPAVSAQATDADIDHYVRVFGEFVDAIAG